MIARSIGFTLFLFLTAFAGEALAWTPFGTAEHTTRIEDVTLTTPDGEALYLGHKTSTVFFILGVYVHDDGYVLGVRSKPGHIGDMPPPKVLAELQQKGLLPDPLPPYHLGLGDYLAGFSLWLVVGPLIGIYLYFHFTIRSRRRRRRAPRY